MNPLLGIAVKDVKTFSEKEEPFFGPLPSHL